MIRVLKRANQSLVATLLALLAPGGVAAEEPLWFWMEDCGGPMIRLELEFDGAIVQDATIPICSRLRSAKPNNQAKTISVWFTPPRAIVWSGYKETAETSPANQPLQIDIWEAGADPKDMILGVSVSDNQTIYMNTLSLAFPDKAFEAPLAEGFIIRSAPVANEK